MKKYLLPFCFLSNFIYAKQSNSDLFLIDEVVANVGTEPVFFSDLQTTLSQLRYQNENFDEQQVVEQLLQNAAIISKAKEISFFADRREVSVRSKVDERMNFLLNKFSNNKKMVERYFGKKFYALRKDLTKNLQDQLWTERLQRSFIENVRCTNKDVIKFFQKLERENKVPSIDESFEAYELILYAEEDPKILNTLLEIRERIDNGEDFTKLVEEYSQDEDTVNNGGELGWFKIGELKDEYEKAALSLKPGQISKIVKTNVGYHIIQLIDTKEGEFNSRHIFLFSSFNDDLSSLFEKAQGIKNKILNNEISWNEAVKQFSNEESSKASFGLITNGYKNFSTQKDISDEDFEIIKDLKEGEISKPISCFVDERKAVRIIYLHKKNPSRTLNLHDDYEQLYDMTRNYKNQMIFSLKTKKVADEVDVKIDDAIIKM